MTKGALPRVHEELSWQAQHQSDLASCHAQQAMSELSPEHLTYMDAGTTRSVGRFGTAASGDTHAVLGVTKHHGGHVAVYGDSNCLDSSHMRTPCFRLLSKLLTYVTTVRMLLCACGLLEGLGHAPGQEETIGRPSSSAGPGGPVCWHCDESSTAPVCIAGQRCGGGDQ